MKKAGLVARMDTTRFSGAKSVTVYVAFDRPRYQEVRLLVQAYGRDDLHMTPESLAFGKVKRGTGTASSVTMTFYGTSDLKVQNIKVESNYIQPKVSLVRREANEVVYQVSARMRSDAPVGKWYSDLWVRTNSPSMPQIRVPLTIEIESALSVTPEAVSIGQVKADTEAERRVIVAGIKPFRITAIEGTDSELSVQDSRPRPKRCMWSP